MKQPNIKLLVANAFIAGIYTVLSLTFAPITFNTVQFRIAELLNLLPFINPQLGFGVILGCFFTNLSSPFLLDIIIGTLCTGISIVLIIKSKNLFIASLMPAIGNIPVGIMLGYILKTPYILNILSVMVGELIVVTFIGYPLFKIILKNEKLVQIIKNIK